MAKLRLINCLVSPNIKGQFKLEESVTLVPIYLSIESDQ
jgi:hypothetical protein